MMIIGPIFGLGLPLFNTTSILPFTLTTTDPRATRGVIPPMTNIRLAELQNIETEIVLIENQSCNALPQNDGLVIYYNAGNIDETIASLDNVARRHGIGRPLPQIQPEVQNHSPPKSFAGSLPTAMHTRQSLEPTSKNCLVFPIVIPRH
ncbi:hypothetical protein BC829DRAFT_141750 [Chytridium lagenaria]|nr:hypothetical protein BC829DRAFT_141750 [Chytridium lagenaria]